MSRLKSRLPGKNSADLNAFIGGAEERTGKKASTQVLYPWQERGVRSDITKMYNLRLPEPYFLKLKYISDRSPESMQKFCLDILQKAIDKRINQLINAELKEESMDEPKGDVTQEVTE